jgi:uncharacterized protein involved in exopolysaccharide biosynthesis
MLQMTVPDERIVRELRRRKLRGVARPFAVAPVQAPAEAHGIQTIAGEILAIADVLWRSRWLIALTTALTFLAGVIFLLTQTPLYQSVAQIMIDPRAKQVIEGSVVQPGLGSSALGADTLLVDSQVEIVGSRPVLTRVIEEQRLTEDPEFFAPKSGSMRGRIRNWLGSFFPGYEPEIAYEIDPVDIVIDRFYQRNLWINRNGNTYIVDVGVLSEDPLKATRIANGIVDAYLAEISNVSSSTTREATQSLEAGIDGQRDRVRISEAAVEAYRKEKGLIGSQGILVDEQQLRDLNARLVLARTQTAAAKARLEQLRTVSAREIDVAATTVALQSLTIANLRSQYGTAAQREEQLSETLGRKHPDLIAVRAELKGIEKQISAELGRIRASAANELKLAEANQDVLERALDDLKSRAEQNNESQIKLRELEREAEAARAVFESYLLRAKQTSEQEKLESNNTRVLSYASVPLRISYPPTSLALAASILIGFGLGVAIAWLRYVLGK